MAQKSGAFRHYGWVIVLAGALISGAGIGLFGNCIGAFVKPVSADLGFSRGSFTLYTTISTLTAALILPLYGELLLRVPARRVMLVCAAVCGGVPLLYSLSSKLWQFYLVSLLNGFFVNGITMMAVGTLIDRWFAARRGLAVGAAFAGTGLLAAVMLPVVRWIIARFGWRWGYRVLGLAGLSILLPVILFLIRERPSDMGLTPIGGEDAPGDAPAKGLTRQEARRTLSFWLAAAGLLIANLCNLGLFNHTIPYLTDLGYGEGPASLAASAAMLLMIGTKLLMGAALDRLGMCAGALLLGGSVFSAALLALLVPSGFWAVLLLAPALAACGTVNSIPASYFTTALFGRRNFAAVYARLTMAASLGSALGTPLSGAIFDATGSYRTAWWGYLVGGVLTALLLFLACRRRPAWEGGGKAG